MLGNAHTRSLGRLEELISSPKSRARLIRPKFEDESDLLKEFEKDSWLRKLIVYSGVSVSPLTLTFISAGLGIVSGVLSSQLLPAWISLAITCAVTFYPIALLDQKAQKRALEFASDFPSVLLATASSLSAGHTALVAIERSTRLLPTENPVRKEIAHLLDILRTGTSKEIAIRRFAKDIRLPELDLFRSAFLLSLESGGKFSPTLERLAQVLKDRAILIASARTATAVMRMTSAVLVLFTPLIVGMVALRTPDFFMLLTTHPIASQIGSLGVLLIGLNCWILRRMSDFRP